MLRLTLIVAVAFAAATAQANTQDNHDLVYNPDTGSLTIVVKTGRIAMYVMESSRDSFLAENHVSTISLEEVAPGFFFKTGLQTSQPHQLHEASSLDILLGPAEDRYGPGSYNIGRVLQPNLTESEFLGVFDLYYQYNVGPGIPAKNFNLVYAPEPTSLALLGFGGLLVTRRR